jgi:hypothetical protein
VPSSNHIVFVFFVSGTKEHALIDIVANRSNFQRQQIKQQYRAMFGAVGDRCLVDPDENRFHVLFT